MTDIVDLLREKIKVSAPYEPEYWINPTPLDVRAADEIESLRDMLREIVDEVEIPEELR